MIQNRTASGEECYPHKYDVSISIPEFIKRYVHLEKGQKAEGNVESIAGRNYSKRESGKKLIFYDLKADGQRLQVFANAR